MPTATEIVQVARSYIGTPFKHQGRIKGQGIDCVGIILGIAEELQISLVLHPDFQRYGRRARQRPLLEYMDEQFLLLDKKELGAICVSWHDNRTKEPSHLGIITDKGLVHTSGRLGATIEEYWSLIWDERTVAYYTYPGVQ